jgi:predicted PurR-regulated permease PerM
MKTMSDQATNLLTMTKPRKISYAFMAIMLAVVASMHLATPLLTVLFSLFCLHIFKFGGRKFLASGLFVCVCAGILMGLLFFSYQVYYTTPEILDKLIPKIMSYAEQYKIKIPFEDKETFKQFVGDGLLGQAGLIGTSLEVAGRQMAMIIIGIVVAISLFANSAIVLDDGEQTSKNNLYFLSAEEIGSRFRTFYRSFATVMGAQIVISAINAFATAMFIMIAQLPYAWLLVVVTFLCGLLPIVGNLISNTIIFCVALTVSPGTAFASLAFLIIVHKLEYFLNSQIVGHRIRNPMWLTLLALVVGERLMGIAGMILAPIILHYVKTEASKVRIVQRKRQESDEMSEEMDVDQTLHLKPSDVN